MSEVVLDRVLGRGRHATVWSAHVDGHAVACKRWDDPRGVGAARERAVRACVTHPHLLGMLPTSGDDLLLPLGRESLAVAAKDRPLTGGDLLRLAAQVAGALAALHDAGWIHGDVAPTNVLSLGEGWVLADLDQAGPIEDPPRGVGTRGYAAPEVLAGGPGSVAADIHALAATLAAAAHGRDRLPEPVASWVHQALVPAPLARPALDELLDTIRTPATTATPDRTTPTNPSPPTASTVVDGAPDPVATTVDFLPVGSATTADADHDRDMDRAPGAIALAGLALTLVTTSGTGRHVALLVQAVPALAWLVASLLPAGVQPSALAATVLRWWTEVREAGDPGSPGHWPPTTAGASSIRPSPRT